MPTQPVSLVSDGAEHGVSNPEGVGPGWWFVALGGGAREQDIVEIRIIDVQFVGTDPDYGAVCHNRQN